MKPVEEFIERNKLKVSEMAKDSSLAETTKEWFGLSSKYEYSYHFRWLGVPIIQFPQDIVALQEIIWQVKPDLIIETGIAHGGSLILSASILELIGGEGKVVGIDIDIRSHNREVIENHPLFKRIELIEGSSIAEETISQVREMARGKERVLVILDSNHTHEHVAQELRHYSPLVTVGSYCIVFDTVIEDMPENSFPDRPWDKGDNPKTAVWEFLRGQDAFEIDQSIQNKLLITVAPDGYLKRIN
jgi:cephalosporin hydroxylase